MPVFTKYIALIGFMLLLVACDSNRTETRSLDNFVSKDAVAVFKISNLNTFRQETVKNKVAKQFSTKQIYDMLGDDDSFLQYIYPEGVSLISITQRNDSVQDLLLSTKQTPLVLRLDSIGNKQIETLTYNKINIQRITLDNQLFFTAIKDSVFIAASSQVAIQNVLTETEAPNPNFSKALSVLKNNELTTIVTSPQLEFPNGPKVTLSAYQSLDMVLSPNGAIASGVALVHDSVPQLLSVFRGQVPQQNDLEQIIPVNANAAISFTLSDAALFLKNLSTYRNQPNTEPPLELLSSTNEIGEVILPEGNAIVLKSIDPTNTREALAASLSELGVFREVTLFDYNDVQLFKKTFSPFVQTDSVTVAFELDQFFVFAESNQVAETIIASYKNNSCLNKGASFENSSSYISNASSLLFYGMNASTQKVIEQVENSANFTADSTKKDSNLPLALLQYSFDRDFAHVHFVCLETAEGGTLTQGNVSEKFSKTLDTDLLSAPQFFSDHQSGKKNVVVQDLSNTLHLLSNTGKTLWTKKLDGPIVGKVQEIDLLRNGKKQMTFSTKNKWYVIDRNGKDVSGFPVKFKDDITQPLSVFDYDNNRKYRFVIIQDKEVLMYDSKAKIVSGFTFKKAKSTIVLPAEHIRMGNKDYILLAEENGTLNILSRTGKVRVPVNSTFNFTENRLEREGSSFVVITKENEKKSISSSGKISTVALDVSNNYHFVTKGNTKVTLDDNLLRINGKLAELPFGIYTAPKIFKENRQTYITVTETQENKVYVFDNSSALLSNFPIYGSSEAEISASSKNTWLVVSTGRNGVTTYQLD